MRVWDTISITHIYKSRQYIFTCTVVLVLVIAWGACCSCALWRCPPPTLRYHPWSCGAREQLTPLSSPPSEYFSWGRGAGAECLCLESVWAFYLPPPFFLFFFGSSFNVSLYCFFLNSGLAVSFTATVEHTLGLLLSRSHILLTFCGAFNPAEPPVWWRCTNFPRKQVV